MLTRLLARLGLLRRNRLDFVSGPTEVTLLARLASPSTAESPMTGQRAALIKITAGQRILVHGSAHPDSRLSSLAMEGPPREVFRPLGSTIIGGDVLLETPDGLVEVPAMGLEMVFPGVQNLAVMSIDRPLPPQLAHVLARVDEGIACYQELCLSQGDLVQLSAVVSPRAAAPTDPAGQPIPWRARPDLGLVILEDRSLSEVTWAR